MSKRNGKTSKARQAILKDNMEKDLIAKGFHKLASKLISRKPPKIKWGKLYQKFTDKEKIEYLEKLASTMNHAAYLIQEERNQRNDLLELKEKQLIASKKALDDSNEMMQTLITDMNEYKQEVNRAFAESKNGNDD